MYKAHIYKVTLAARRWVFDVRKITRGLHVK